MDWDNAQEWAEEANKDKQSEQIEPRWSWDCGLKLDFDGGLLRVSSRFYQIQKDTFDGGVFFYIGDNIIFHREFSSRHIDVLKVDVEKYVRSVTENLQKLFATNLEAFLMKNDWF